MERQCKRQTYKLNTVTYRATCAPYLATRTIQQLVRNEGEHYPLAASVTIRDIYMDILTEWDELLSNPITKEWNDFVSTLPVIQNIHVPRLVIGKGRIIIHGFADASTAGVVLYAQSISEEDVSTRLVQQIPCCTGETNHYPSFLQNSRNPSVKRSGQLDYSEVNEAELCLIKNLQASAFQEEIEYLAKGGCN
ncbi:hypothetical protein TNCV_3998461 [Trichonephila clavipes]|nr:hypothetical protein TNCV_3998461 [Trichonephila clavipes]